MALLAFQRFVNSAHWRAPYERAGNNGGERYFTLERFLTSPRRVAAISARLWYRCLTPALACVCVSVYLFVALLSNNNASVRASTKSKHIYNINPKRKLVNSNNNNNVAGTTFAYNVNEIENKFGAADPPSLQ